MDIIGLDLLVINFSYSPRSENFGSVQVRIFVAGGESHRQYQQDDSLFHKDKDKEITRKKLKTTCLFNNLCYLCSPQKMCGKYINLFIYTKLTTNAWINWKENRYDINF